MDTYVYVDIEHEPGLGYYWAEISCSHGQEYIVEEGGPYPTERLAIEAWKEERGGPDDWLYNTNRRRI